jgi:hypothetical protein
MADGPCRSTEVVAYLDALAEEAREEVVVVLDNAPFDTAGMVKERGPFYLGRARTHYSALSAVILSASELH